MLVDFRYILPISKKVLYGVPFNTEQQKTIAKAYERQDLILLEEVFDGILSACILNEGFDPLKLHVRDRQALLIYMRIESVKGDYIFKTNCHNEECRHEREIAINIEDLKLENEIKDVQEKQITINDHLSLTLGGLTRQSEKDIYDIIIKWGGNHPQIGDNDVYQIDYHSALYAGSIREVFFDGEAVDINFNDKLEIIDTLLPKDLEPIKEHVSLYEEESKINISLDIVCSQSECRYEYIHEISWIDFFYHVMMGDVNFEVIFKEVGALSFSEQINFTKSDIDKLAPFERQAYIDLFAGFMKEQERGANPDGGNGTPSHANSFE